jgi:integrase/recombinase XerD
MAFSCKIVLGWRAKEDKSKMVYVQAIINRLRALVPLEFYLRGDQFDQKRQLVKNHPASKDLNDELAIALAKAHTIASKFRKEERLLTPDEFKREYKDPSEKMDVIKFCTNEIGLKSLAENTRKRHTTVFNKLGEYRRLNKKKYGSFLAFQHLTPEFIQLYKNYLLEDNKITTVNKELSIIKEYLTIAAKKDIKFKDPFDVTKIKHFQSSKIGLTQKEVDRLEGYYFSEDCNSSHKRLLQYFLFSCYMGVRISDIRSLTWNDIHDGVIVKQLEKGKDNNPKMTVIPISKPAKKFLPSEGTGRHKIFKPFTEQYSNRMLKEIIKLDAVKIKKDISFHTSRHTYGSLFAQGGNIVALQKLMGHGSMSTTMGYVHTNPEDLIKAVKDRFGE